MPILPLPAITDPGSSPVPGVPLGTALDAGALVATTEADVLAVYPKRVQDPDTAPVRDGLVGAIFATLQAHELAASNAAGQCDVLRATGVFLDEIGGEYGVLRQAGEIDGPYLARIIATKPTVTVAIILSLANGLLAAHTATKAQLCTDADRWFVHDTAYNSGGSESAWHSFVFDRSDTGPLKEPNYPDRLYEINGSGPGTFRPGSNAYGAIVTNGTPQAGGTTTTPGRFFLLRIPDLSGSLSAVPEFSVYNQIANVVEQVHGHSIRWELIADAHM